MAEVIQEHNKIPYSLSQEKYGEGLRLPSDMDRWFFQWQWKYNGDSGYYASYVIGAKWVEDKDGNKLPLVITTKEGCDKIDFLKMFSTCFNSGIAAEEFAKIYDVDMTQPTIDVPELNSVLSPLIVVHFLSVVQKIVKRGLKKDYVNKEENLKKVKGRIDIFRNERKNILTKRYDRVYCKFQEFSENTPENRLIKKALRFAQQILNNAAASKGFAGLQHSVQQFLSAFSNVDEQIEVWEVKAIKHNKIFKEYDAAIKLAQLILRRYDYNITNITAKEEKCPVFWLDMALLYEHYVLGLLKEAYGDKIKYQAHGYSGYPDFICYEPKVVMDTKYIPRFENGSLDSDIVRQLSGYARDRKLFKDRPAENIPCLVIYPKESEAENPFKDKPLESFLEKEDNQYWNFYRVAVPLPMLQTPQGN